MQIREKLIIGLAGISLLVGAVGVSAILYNRNTQRHVRELRRFPIALNDRASDMSTALVSSQKAAQEMFAESQRAVLEPDEKLDSEEAARAAGDSLAIHLSQFQQHLADARAIVEADLRASRGPGGDAHEIVQEQAELTMLDAIHAELVVYRDNLASFTALITSKLADADEVLAERVEPHYAAKLLPLVNAFKAEIKRELADDNATIDSAISYVNRMLLVSTVGALLIALLLGIYIARAISEPIRKLGNAAVEIGKGNLSTRVDLHSDDELGTLARAFNQMTEGLSRTTISRGFLDNILTSMVDALVVVDRNMRIEKVNQATLDLLGFTEPELTGKPIGLILRDDVIAGAKLASSDKQAVIRGAEASYVARDGTTIPMSISASAMRAEGGELQGVVYVAQDITARKRMEADIITARDTALESTRLKSEFLANMSHEIRTPMNGVLGMLDLALDTPLTPEQRDYVSVAKSSADSLLSVINDILDFSKIEAGKLDLDIAPFRLGDAMSDTASTLAVRAHEKGLELSVDIAPDVPDLLTGDLGRLRQIVINLVGNAIKFTAHGEVVLRIVRESMSRNDEPMSDVTLHVSVTDTGVGISTEKQHAIFEAFEQADASTTREFGGTGLGLSISRRLVQLMGGRMWVDSVPGSGSTFHFTATFGQPVRSADIGDALTTVDLEGVPVLVVDDNATNRRVLDRTLARWRMKPTLADGGANALAALERAALEGESYRVMLLDAHMPEMDGFDLAERIAADPRFAGTRILMLSSSRQREDVARARALGIDLCLVKPVRRAELLDALRACLGRGERSKVPEWAPTSAPSRQLRVLVAEDNAVNQKLVRAVLEKRGHRVTVVGNGRLAVDEWERARSEGGFQIVLMDIQMPEMGGFEATGRIRTRERELGVARTPIVALTARAMQGDREECLAAGMDGYLSKPLRSEDLYATIDAFVPNAEISASVVEAEPGAHGAGDAAEQPSRSRAVGPPSRPVLDEARLLRTVEGDVSLLGELVELFFQETPKLMQKTRRAIDAGDAQALQFAAHALKGSLGTLSATEAHDAALALETMGLQRNLDPAEAGFTTLEAALQRLEAALPRLVQQQSRSSRPND